MNLAIVDANVVGELFSGNSGDAGPKLLEWIERGRGWLTYGGKNREELRENETFRDWADNAVRYDRLRRVDDGVVRDETKRLIRVKANSSKVTYRSNDPHVIALARVGGARLLFTNDGKLHKDFTNSGLIRDPRGKVYTTRLDRRKRRKRKFRLDKRFTKTHRALLARNDLSGKPQVGT